MSAMELDKIAEESTTEFVEIREGSASMSYNKNEAVFYNKIQVFNRDISIQVIRLFASIREQERTSKYIKSLAKYNSHPESYERAPRAPPEGISILDALAATGLRSVRYLKEIPGCRHVTINDLEPAAVEAAAVNCRTNGVEDSRYSVHHGDASLFMYGHREPNQQFDVIDLDPYGTACPFLDSAVQAVSDGGLLCVTCTDMPTLSGNYPEVCFAKYGCMPVKAKYTHELSLRILLHAIDSAANRYKRHIVPWVSLSVDFYVRVFVRVFECPAEVKRSSLKRGMLVQSTQCPSFYVQPIGRVLDNGATYAPPHVSVPRVCEETGGAMKIGGPFWMDPIHKQDIVDELLRRLTSVVDPATTTGPDLPFTVSTAKRAVGVLTCISEELKDVPLYYLLPELTATVRSNTPTSEEFFSALLNAGYRVSQFHHEPTAIKTDAPPSVIWDIIRTYCKLNPPQGSSHKKPSEVAAKILSNPTVTEVSFATHPSWKRGRAEMVCADGSKKRVVKFPSNPEENWGPKRRAGRLLNETASAAATAEVVGEVVGEVDTDLKEEEEK